MYKTMKIIERWQYRLYSLCMRSYRCDLHSVQL
jgi:hypothetical protein